MPRLDDGSLVVCRRCGAIVEAEMEGECCADQPDDPHDPPDEPEWDEYTHGRDEP